MDSTSGLGAWIAPETDEPRKLSRTRVCGRCLSRYRSVEPREFCCAACRAEDMHERDLIRKRRWHAR